VPKSDVMLILRGADRAINLPGDQPNPAGVAPITRIIYCLAGPSWRVPVHSDFEPFPAAVRQPQRPGKPRWTLAAFSGSTSTNGLQQSPVAR
jgi:hypothetical protein